MSSVPSFSAPPRRAAAPAGAPTTFSSFGRPPRPSEGGGGGFDAAAASAFGKKPARVIEEPLPPVAAPKITPARNTLGSLLEGKLPEPEQKEREWSRSALQQQRRAAAEAEKAKPPPPKSFDEEFPALGGAGGVKPVVRVPKPVFATTGGDSETKQGSGSFASLAANWAKSDEERKAAEAYAARLRLEQQRREEFEHSQRTRIYMNRQQNSYHFNQYDEEHPYDDYDEYAEDELGEDEYTEKDRRADRRAAANHYSDEEEEEVDEDQAW